MIQLSQCAKLSISSTTFLTSILPLPRLNVHVCIQIYSKLGYIEFYFIFDIAKARIIFNKFVRFSN